MRSFGNLRAEWVLVMAVLVMEQAHARVGHGDAVLAAGRLDLLVPGRAAGLGDGAADGVPGELGIGSLARAAPYRQILDVESRGVIPQFGDR